MIFKNLYFFFILSILHPLHYAVIEGIYISCTYREQNIKILTFDFIKCSRKGRNFFILQIYLISKYNKYQYRHPLDIQVEQ